MARSDLKDRRRRCFVDLQQAEQDLAAARKDHDQAVAGEAPVARLRELAARVTAFEADVAMLEKRRDLLALEANKVDTAAAEQARTEAIAAVLQPQADDIIAKAERLERAVAELADAYADISKAVAAMFVRWPAAVPRLPFYQFSLMDVRQRLTGAFGYASAGGEFGRLLTWVNTFGERTTTLSESVKRGLTNYIRDLKAQPLPAAKPIRETIDV